MRSLFEFSPEYLTANERFGSFLRDRVAPGAQARDAEYRSFDAEFFRDCAQIGLIGATLPAEIGGGGMSWWQWSQTLELIAFEGDDSSLPMLLAYRDTAANMIAASATLLPREAIVAAHLRGDEFVGWAFTETSDYFSLATTCTKVNGGYLVNGAKPAVTGGLGDRYFMVYCRDSENQDLRVLLVDCASPGFSMHPKRSMGLRAIGLASIELNGVFVPDDHVVAAFDGISHAQKFIRDRRLTLGSWVAGRLMRLCQKVIEALDPLERFGAKVLSNNAVQADLGRMVANIHIVRTVTERMVRDADAGRTLTALSLSTGKHLAAQCAVETAHIAQRLLGGMGFWEEHGFDRYLRDVYGLLPILGGPIAIEQELGSRAIEHYFLDRSGG
jgi:alkylation response protein AidB-like acyl-CoA dehydrogenase